MSFQTPRRGKNVNPCWDDKASASVVPRPSGCLGARGPTVPNTAGFSEPSLILDPEGGWGDLG